MDLSRPEILQLVAEKLAKFHSLDMPLCKKPRWMPSVMKRSAMARGMTGDFFFNSHEKVRLHLVYGKGNDQ